jgi:hypothetical protein
MYLSNGGSANLRIHENTFSLQTWTSVSTNVKDFIEIMNTDFTVKPAYVVTSIKQSPVLKGHFFLVLSQIIWY